MDELLAIGKALGAAGGGTAVLIWVVTRPHVIASFHTLGDWLLKWRGQQADITAAKIRQLIEQEASINAARHEVNLQLRADLSSARAELSQARTEITSLVEMERDCQGELHHLRVGQRVIIQQNLSQTEQLNALRALTDASVKLHNERDAG